MRWRSAWVDRAARRKGVALSCLGIAYFFGFFTEEIAGAEEPLPVEHVRLLYTRARGAEACPDEQLLVSEVVARLGYDPFVSYDARTLEVGVTSDATQLRATITLRSAGAAPSTHRLVSSARDCSVLRPALGSSPRHLAIDPSARARRRCCAFAGGRRRRRRCRRSRSIELRAAAAAPVVGSAATGRTDAPPPKEKTRR